MKHLLVALLFAFATLSYARTPEEWASRTIYQLLTDRFAKTDGDTAPCDNLSNYCGGTFQGIMNNLDYIAGMGFDAIWISPIVANMPGNYHGYAAENIYEINPYFGTSDDLKNLVNACHQKNIWVMLDVVGNHMGCLTSPGVYSDKVPFNDSSYYHVDVDCGNVDTNNATQLETCWLAQLADLNQDNEYVRTTLLSWISDIVNTYNIDGLRIDTVPYVNPSFWAEFTQASGVYTVGEVYNGYLPYCASFQGPVNGILNYPYFYTLRSVFQQYGSMNNLQNYFAGATTWPDQTLLGNFVDNHDNARFLNYNGDHTAFKSALAFSLSTVGIPIVYYGSEQAYGGGADPNNREPLWTNMYTNSEIYLFLQQVIAIRKQTEFYLYDQIQRYSDDNFYAFSRGNYFFAFTNHGYNLGRTITYHPYADGTVLCNLMYNGDCVTVQNGAFQVDLNNGEVKIYAPKSSQADKEEEEEVKRIIRENTKSQQTIKAEIAEYEQEIQQLLKEEIEVELSGEDEVFKTNAMQLLQDAVNKRQEEIEVRSYQYKGLLSPVTENVEIEDSTDTENSWSSDADPEDRLHKYLAENQYIADSNGIFNASSLEAKIQDLLKQQASIETSTMSDDDKQTALSQLAQQIDDTQIEIQIRTYQYLGVAPTPAGDFVLPTDKVDVEDSTDTENSWSSDADPEDRLHKYLAENQYIADSNGIFNASSLEAKIQDLLKQQASVETSTMSDDDKQTALSQLAQQIDDTQVEIQIRTYQYLGVAPTPAGDFVLPVTDKVDVEDSTDTENSWSSDADPEDRLQKYLAENQYIADSNGIFNASSLEAKIQDLLKQQASVETSTMPDDDKQTALSQLAQQIDDTQVEIQIRTYQYLGVAPSPASDDEEEVLAEIEKEEKNAQAAEAAQQRIQQLLAEQLNVDLSDLPENSKAEALRMISSRIAYLEEEVQVRDYQYKGLTTPTVEEVKQVDTSREEEEIQELLKEEMSIALSNESDEYKAHAMEIIGAAIKEVQDEIFDKFSQ